MCLPMAVALNSMGLEIQKNTGTEILPADCVVMATGSESENRLLRDIKELVPTIYIMKKPSESVFWFPSRDFFGLSFRAASR